MVVCPVCCPAMGWQPVQGVPRLSPTDCWRSAPATPYGRSLYRKWMDALPNENAIKPCFVSLLFDITRSVSPPHVKSVGLRRNCCMFAIMLFTGFLIHAAASITRCLLTEEIKRHNYFDQPFPCLT
ncbi:hypothetical protein GOODEAATRI_012659 [Goodea atripinnis]|uniref:Uncharacterized protein n=1 Tax=Goodea atripinnis TaxID=208336 RepID=A0ABV0PDL2_9TELE